VTSFDYYGALRKFDKDLIFYPNIWKRNLRIGSQGEDVKALQKILINEGLWDSQAGATGYFGQVTANALARFQELNKSSILDPYGLQKGTGYFGSKTKDVLEDSVSFSLEDAIENIFSKDLYLGSRGEDVKKFQEILIQEGVWEREDIGATGYFGPVTKRAAERLQEKYSSDILEPLGLTKPTGFIGKSTREYLNKLNR
jgi:peptidoglycan hydrolase-like protein with peptidoglycan-binding domain